jgi:hypothetical protein
MDACIRIAQFLKEFNTYIYEGFDNISANFKKPLFLEFTGPRTIYWDRKNAEKANYFNYNLVRGTVKGRFKQDLSDLFCILATHKERRKMPTASFVGQVRNGNVSLAKVRLQVNSRKIVMRNLLAQFLT